MRTTRRPSLSDYDRADDTFVQTREARRFANKPRAPDWPVLHCNGCWCGSEFGHDWPGKADGAPHPRDWPGRVSGRGYR
jgi:hypothetical protein